jgi:hypothetical protein
VRLSDVSSANGPNKSCYDSGLKLDVCAGSSGSSLLSNIINAKESVISDSMIALRTGVERSKAYRFQLGRILVSRMFRVAFSCLYLMECFQLPLDVYRYNQTVATSL